MPYIQLILDAVPELSGKNLTQFIDVLYALADALENPYYAQIRQEQERLTYYQYDLFKANPDPLDFDGPLPDF
jgi:hypothetical protein